MVYETPVTLALPVGSECFEKKKDSSNANDSYYVYFIIMRLVPTIRVFNLCLSIAMSIYSIWKIMPGKLLAVVEAVLHKFGCVCFTLPILKRGYISLVNALIGNHVPVSCKGMFMHLKVSQGQVKYCIT